MEDLKELIKEVFACFGAAYYRSEILHRKLCNIYALMTFEKVEDIIPLRMDEKQARADTLTLGQIIEQTKDLLPSELQQRLQVALEKRNYLAHHYSKQNLLKMRQELLELGGLFIKLDEDISEYVKPKREAFGITDELIQEYVNASMGSRLTLYFHFLLMSNVET